MKTILYTAVLIAGLACSGAACAQISSAPGATIPSNDSMAAGTYGVQGSTSNTGNLDPNGTPPKPAQKMRRHRTSASGAMGYDRQDSYPSGNGSAH